MHREYDPRDSSQRKLGIHESVLDAKPIVNEKKAVYNGGKYFQTWNNVMKRILIDRLRVLVCQEMN